MTWVLIAWSVLILVWAIAGGASAECENEEFTEACEAGTGIGIALVLLVGFIGFVFLSLIWFMTRPKGRQCPQCGNDVKKGQTQCAKCGFSFMQPERAPHADPVPSDRPPPGAPKPAGWYPDPGGGFDYRYFDGGWTDHVSNEGEDSTHIDPVPPRRPS